ncbi:MAG: transporter substrate-binding domain-containing protein [Phycisphaerales bacterium]
MVRRLVILFALLLALLCMGSPAFAQHQPTRKLIYGGDQNFRPMEWLDEKGKPTGFQIDLIRAIGREMNLDVEVRLGPWVAIRDEWLKGKIDLVALFDQPSRREFADFCNPFAVQASEIFVRTSDEPMTSLDELRDKTILIQSGSLIEDELRWLGLPAKVISFPDHAAALEALARGEGDCAIAVTASGRDALTRLGLDNVTTCGQFLLSSEVAFAARKGDEALRVVINEGLARLRTSGEFNKIYDKWFGELERPAISFKKAVKIFALCLGVAVAGIFMLVVWNRALQRRVGSATIALREEFVKRQEAEAQQHRMSLRLRDAQRIESLRLLAGGVGHDINNMVMVIRASADGLDQPGKAHENVARIDAACEQVYGLAMQLMDYAGKRGAKPRENDLSATVESQMRLMRSTLPPGVKIHLDLADSLPHLWIDQTQLSQVILNLVKNAVDACRGNGQISVSTRLVDADRVLLDAARHGDHRTPGTFVAMEVADTGAGIPDEIVEHIFEPFYTTKSSSGGYGLGLSVVDSIVRDNGAALTLSTRPGKGTTFTVLFPPASVAAPSRSQPGHN